MSDERQRQINAIRSVCDFLEAHPGFELPFAFTQRLSVYVNGRESIATHARMLGSGQKSVDDTFFRFTSKIGGADIELVDYRSAVCERVVVGTREVEVEQPDPVAVAALPMVKVKSQVEIVEWHCPETLLAAQQSAH